jgi:hypothetical protein
MPRTFQSRSRSAWLSAGLALLAAAPSLAQPPAAFSPPSHEPARASFRRFAEGWMAAARLREAQQRQKPAVRPGAAEPLVTYRGYGEDLRIDVQPTGHAAAPYLGFLRYTEHIYTCRDVRAVHCTVASSIPVTEIFRFRGGRWVY